MYYLDLHQLYKNTKKSERIKTRRTLNRDENMLRALKNQRDSCFFCGVAIDISGHLDHLIPVYYGGNNRKSNLVATCKDCNLLKSTQQIEITNTYTIFNYQNLQRHHSKMLKKYKKLKREGKPTHNVFKGKKYRLYKLYRADLFKSI